MKYVDCDAKSFMSDLKSPKKVFSLWQVKYLLKQLLPAVSHLHSNCIMHSDLKPSKILLTHSGILKVGDFETARNYDHPPEYFSYIDL